jgi:hypothetical protein
MKTLVAFAAVLFAVSHVVGASTGVTLVQSTEVKPAEAKPTPVAKPAVKKEEKPKEPVIPGMTIVRPNGTFIGFEVVGGKFKLSFYDKKKKLMPIDVTGGLARWPNARGPGDNRSPLNPSGTALISAKTALPPFNYNIYITLLKGEGEDAKAAETYTVMFRG